MHNLKVFLHFSRTYITVFCATTALYREYYFYGFVCEFHEQSHQTLQSQSCIPMAMEFCILAELISVFCATTALYRWYYFYGFGMWISWTIAPNSTNHRASIPDIHPNSLHAAVASLDALNCSKRTTLMLIWPVYNSILVWKMAPSTVASTL